MEIKLDSLVYDDNGNLYTGIMKGDVQGKYIEYEVINGRKHGSFKLYYQNGNPEIEGYMRDNINDSLWKYYYPDGTLELQGYFVNDSTDGEWLWYYPSGKIRETSVYKRGVRHGKLIMYDEDGKIISESLYDKGIEIKIN
ncbi:MAG: toxin-antitoxin system YwqK family antitoxin [Ignavibacteriales bacterium]|nr:MAG: toxin-antitoxin system YwqK family antitoxin [Ignavibacteriales bacterium]